MAEDNDRSHSEFGQVDHIDDIATENIDKKAFAISSIALLTAVVGFSNE